MNYLAKSLQETEKLAKQFALKIKCGDIVLLNGDLGAGKTTFTQFVFKELGVKDVVNSPTFSIIKTYKGKFLLHHVDAYRITAEEAVAIGLNEMFNDAKAVFFIEWAENISGIIPKRKIKKINIKYVDENKREITINE